MNNRDQGIEEYRSLLLLDEISRNNELTQRDLSRRLGIALGLINSYIKNLVSRGYITVAAIPRNRYKYYLTPRGFAEKTRLTCQHLQNFTSLYRVARKEFQALFSGFRTSRVRKVVFCGVDEVTEIAYLSLEETGLELAGIIDKDGAVVGKKFFGHDIRRIGDVVAMDYDVIVITSFRGGAEFREKLLERGVEEDRICDVSGGGWLKRIGS